MGNLLAEELVHGLLGACVFSVSLVNLSLLIFFDGGYLSDESSISFPFLPSTTPHLLTYEL